MIDNEVLSDSYKFFKKNPSAFMMVLATYAGKGGREFLAKVNALNCQELIFSTICMTLCKSFPTMFGYLPR
jgi:hypothetical protein